MVDFVVNLLVFILSLGILVTIHEFGHYITAKMFKVYVTEFAIGFGPILFKKKKDNWETQFSLRAVPLGGFCAIVGEDMPDMTDEEYKALSNEDKSLVDLYKTIPPERRLDGISKPKKALIMSAGVILNFILGFLLLVLFFSTSKIYNTYHNYVTVQSGSVVDKAGWTNEDVIYTSTYVITIDGQTHTQTFDCKENENNLLESFYVIDISNEDRFVPVTNEDTATYTLITSKDKTINFTLNVKEKNDVKYFESTGIGFILNNEGTYDQCENIGEVFLNAGYRFGVYSGAIFNAIGELFTPEGFNNVGGIVSIFTVQQTQMSIGFGYVINLWAMISINLGIMNLLPFPGLDGWHLLVTAIEGVTRKELPKKFENIVSTIGMILLFGFMIVILFKDIFMLF